MPDNLHETTCTGQAVLAQLAPDDSGLCAHPLRLTFHDCNGLIPWLSVGKVGKKSGKGQEVLILCIEVKLRISVE